MKRIIYNAFVIIAVTLCLTTFTSCGGAEGGGDSAADKALEMTGYLQDGNYEDYAGQVYLKEGSTDKDVEELALMLEMKGSEMLEKKQGIDSYELISEKISEDGKTATVMVKITYGNGDVVDDKMRMIKDSSDEWKNKIR